MNFNGIQLTYWKRGIFKDEEVSRDCLGNSYDELYDERTRQFYQFDSKLRRYRIADDGGIYGDWIPFPEGFHGVSFPRIRDLISRFKKMF